MEIDTVGFNPQAYPMTNSKKDSITKRLDTVHLFLKEKYVLTGNSVNHTVQELLDEYICYCQGVNRKAYGKQDFNSKLMSMQIKYKKSNDKNMYKVSNKFLLDYANSNNWIHALDEFEPAELNDLENDLINLI